MSEFMGEQTLTSDPMAEQMLAALKQELAI